MSKQAGSLNWLLTEKRHFGRTVLANRRDRWTSSWQKKKNKLTGKNTGCPVDGVLMEGTASGFKNNLLTKPIFFSCQLVKQSSVKCWPQTDVWFLTLPWPRNVIYLSLTAACFGKAWKLIPLSLLLALQPATAHRCWSAIVFSTPQNLSGQDVGGVWACGPAQWSYYVTTPVYFSRHFSVCYWFTDIWMQKYSEIQLWAYFSQDMSSNIRKMLQEHVNT